MLAPPEAESLNWFIFDRGERTTECPTLSMAVSCGRAASQRPCEETKETIMSTPETHDDDNAPVPWMQQLLDNPFLLLFLGVFVPMVVYTVWGVYDILTLPMAK